MRSFFSFLLLSFTLTFSGCFFSSESKIVRLQGETMGTYYRLVIAKQLSEHEEKQVSEKIEELLVEVNRQMSTYIKDSEITLWNQSEQGREVSELFRQTTDESLQLAKKTGGAFDPTIAALVDLWGFGAHGERKVPEQQLIDQTVKKIGYKWVGIEGKKIVKRKPEISLDLSAIAKGKGVDVLSEWLYQQGYQNHLVEIGGEVRVAGMKGDKPWKIGVEVPDQHANGRVQLVVSLVNMAMATSGSYRNFFVENEKSYSHTIDHRTGKPVEHHLLSVSVVHPFCSQADGLATALMVMGEVEGYNYARKLGLKAYFIYADDGNLKTKMTPAFKQLVTKGKG